MINKTNKETSARGVNYINIISVCRLFCLTAAVCVTLLSLLYLREAFAARSPLLSDVQKKELKSDFALCISKLKGPYTENFCVCPNGNKLPVRGADGRIGNPCGGKELFCAAFRAPWAESLTKHGVYLGNIFSRDLYLWDSFSNHHDLVRGYILEKFFVDTHPAHKLTLLKAFGGLSGAEFEAKAAPLFFDRYLELASFRDHQHFLLAYELQKRFFLRADLGQVQNVRQQATRIHSRDPKFKPLRDRIHNQVSAGVIPSLIAYRAKLGGGQLRDDLDELIGEISSLTSLDVSVLKKEVAELSNAELKGRVARAIPGKELGEVEQIAALASLMVINRQSVGEDSLSAPDLRRLIDINVTAAAIIHSIGSRLLEEKQLQKPSELLKLLSALAKAAYGVGLLRQRELAEAETIFDSSSPRERIFAQLIPKAERVIEWAQDTPRAAFAEVSEAWSVILPETKIIEDDILRGSPLLLYGEALRSLKEHTRGARVVPHAFFESKITSGVRPLNPGLVVGVLRYAPKEDDYSREEIIALEETPEELQPAGGILTRGEGNLLSHVQLLARSLGIPNAVAPNDVFSKIKEYQGKEVFFAVAPKGRVILKLASEMSKLEHTAYEEYNRNKKRLGVGEFSPEQGKLKIDRAKLNLNISQPLSLSAVRRRDSGVICGPKAAYLGELKHLFPDNVSRGVVIPFGAYYSHFQTAKVIVPESLNKLSLAASGDSLSQFVEKTYQMFFEQLVPSGKAEKELSQWIRPRLEIIEASIRNMTLSPELKQNICSELIKQNLLSEGEKTLNVGVFVRSDTNVEDLDNFSGAGLNLTLFNLRSLDDIYEGIKQVWASPFSFRSFSWRQTLIDQPLWVLPSIVVLESVPSEKSGVLVTADLEGTFSDKMLIATSEGVGGAVDGTAAETLLWAANRIELIAMFKSPWRRMLRPEGGSVFEPSTGRDFVLENNELSELVSKAQRLSEMLEPVSDPFGNRRPWDIEFGFSKGKLWLFQARPFIGNDEVNNVAALSVLDKDI